MGAVLPSQPIVQRLTDFIWIGTSPVLSDACCLRVAAVLRALKESLNALDNYYDALQYHPLTTLRPSESIRISFLSHPHTMWIVKLLNSDT